MRKLGLSLTLAISMGAGTSAFSQSPAPTVDPAWKAPEVIQFIGLKKGDKVADIVAGRLTGSLAQAVGPSGKVYAVETAEVVRAHPEIMDRMKALATRSPRRFPRDSTLCYFDRTTTISTTNSWDPRMYLHSTRRSSPR